MAAPTLSCSLNDTNLIDYATIMQVPNLLKSKPKLTKMNHNCLAKAVEYVAYG